jgi:Fe-S-cluster containining protein
VIVPLSRPYASRAGAPVIDRVETRIYLDTFFAACFDCTFCHDWCCFYGASVDPLTVERITAHAGDLEAYLGIPRAQWFENGYEEDAGYPGGKVTRTRVVEGACVFLNRRGRGCVLHRFALESGVPVEDVKPMVCSLFPVLWEGGVLGPAQEVRERGLVCLGPGLSLYRSARPALLHYFGADLVAELDVLEGRTHADVPATVALPLLSS